MRGVQISGPNAMGFTVVRVHYTADPEHDPEHPLPALAQAGGQWVAGMRTTISDPADWEREMEINFHSPKGSRVFPQFRELTHTRGLDFTRRKVVYRSWDFGWHAPVCLVAQIGERDRLHLLKEIVGRQQTTQEFAATVVQRCAEWLPQHAAGFEDFCDPAGQQVKSIASEKSERRDVDVLGSFGIHPRYEWGWSRKDGRTLVHRLLHERADRTPGLYVDPAGCPLLLQAFLGRYVYPVTADGRRKDEPDDESHPWADLMAALRYLVSGLYVKLGLMGLGLRPTPPPPAPGPPGPAFHGYGTVRRSA